MENFRVLLVDDNPVNLDVLRVTLKQIADCQVLIANSGQRALELMQRSPPDLVLLDVMMPDMNGFDVCRKIRSTEQLQAIPVIFVTACTEDVSTGFEVGGNDYIGKPINASEVIARVNHQRERARLHRELEQLNCELEEKVRDRTAALVVSNRQLREEIKERRYMQDRLQYLATHDFVTRLYNRNAFDDRATKAVQAAQLGVEEGCLVQLDLDRFRLINESCGYIAGDELLRQFADMLASVIEPDDFLARLGSDKFALICHDLNHGRRLVKFLQQQVKDFEFSWDDRVFSLDASFALVRINRSIVSFDQLMLMVDEVVYQLKQQKVPFLTYDDITQSNPEGRGKVKWAIRIMDGLKREKFRIFFQKVVPLTAPAGADKGRPLVRIETLVRLWDSQKSRVIFPDEFIPSAERYNLIGEIDRWMVASVLQYFSAHVDLLDAVDKISINLSAVSIRDPQLVNFITKILQETGVPPNKVSFEITETEAIINMGSAKQFIDELHRVGVSFALDDFGSGFCSFNYLRELPFDALKIDGVFIKDIDKNTTHLELVKSIIDVGKQLDKVIVAEFVENQAIAEILISLGVGWGQGYFFHKPAPIEELQQGVALLLASGKR